MKMFAQMDRVRILVDSKAPLRRGNIGSRTAPTKMKMNPELVNLR